MPAGLTVTFGFGPGVLDRVDDSLRPTWLKPLPGFDIDYLDDQWTSGDLLVIVSADDQVPMAHSTRMILKDGRGFASLRWRQDGFRRAYGSQPDGTTMRNLFGQVDGTANPRLGTDDFAGVVWNDAVGSDAEGWMAGGTSFVLRRTGLRCRRAARLSGHLRRVARAPGSPRLHRCADLPARLQL